MDEARVRFPDRSQAPVDLHGCREVFQAHVVALPGVLRFVLVILAADAVEYASHRAYHEVPFLWRIHAVHHSPEAMDWLSGSRLHFLEPLITRAFVLVPVFLIAVTCRYLPKVLRNSATSSA